MSVPKHVRTLLDRLVNELKKAFGDKLVSVVLYGSMARGEWRKDSDIDLLIIIEDLPKSRFLRNKIFAEIEAKLSPIIENLEKRGYHHIINPMLKTPDEADKITPLYLDMVYDAIILYDKNNFFNTVLERLKERLKELGARRIRIGRKWYWDLKPDYKFGDVIEIE